MCVAQKNRTFAPEFGKRTMERYLTHYIFLFLGALFSLLIIGCNSSTTWNELEFYNVEKLEQLSEKPLEPEEGEEDEFAALREKENREMDVKVDMQFVKSDNQSNERVCKLINDQLIEVLLKQSSELSIDEAVAQYIEDVKKEFHSDEIANVYYDHLTGRAEYGMEKVINYRLKEEVFVGGAHPSTTTTILRFDAQTGEFISLDNVFPTLNQNKLQELLLDKLMKDTHTHSLAELHEKGWLEMTDMFVSNNFALREDSIEFFYNEYDIAPYANGVTSICLGYDDVKDLISTTWENRK